MYAIEKAALDDIEALVDIQISAFSPDRIICGSGPPGYDDYDHQAKALEKYCYYVIRHESEVVGGFYFLQVHKIINLYRLFIAPACQGLGIGTSALDFLKHEASYGTVIELETPTFSVTAHRFYEKNGFQRTAVIEYGASQAYRYRYKHRAI